MTFCQRWLAFFFILPDSMGQWPIQRTNLQNRKWNKIESKWIMREWPKSALAAAWAFATHQWQEEWVFPIRALVSEHKDRRSDLSSISNACWLLFYYKIQTICSYLFILYVSDLSVALSVVLWVSQSCISNR